MWFGSDAKQCQMYLHIDFSWAPTFHLFHCICSAWAVLHGLSSFSAAWMGRSILLLTFWIPLNNHKMSIALTSEISTFDFNSPIWNSDRYLLLLLLAPFRLLSIAVFHSLYFRMSFKNCSQSLDGMLFWYYCRMETIRSHIFNVQACFFLVHPVEWCGWGMCVVCLCFFHFLR